MKYGARAICLVLTEEDNKLKHTQSVWLQLHKPDRKFTYHVEILPWYRSIFKRLSNNDRPYVIHLNIQHDALNLDILESYYFARLLDFQLQKAFSETPNYFTIEHAIRATEWQFVNEFDIDKFS